MKPTLYAGAFLLVTVLASCGDMPKDDNTGQQTDSVKVDTSRTGKVSARLEKVFSDKKYQLTGVAIAKDGRLFTNYPYWMDKHLYSVVEINKDGSTKPYPDTAWNTFKKGEDGQNKFVCAQAVVTDDQGYLWVVDPAGIALGNVYKNAAKVVKISLATNKVEHIYRFPADVIANTNYINDIRIDNKTGFAYMTISSDGGIIIFDIKTGKSRKVLSKDPSTHSDVNYTMNINGKPFLANGKPAHFNSDGIALSPDGSWLYYKSITDRKLYRVPTLLLRDFSTSEDVIAEKVERLGDFVATDGMEMDKFGNLYLGDLETGSIVKITPDLKSEVLIKDPETLRWPDSYSISEDGYLYISCSQIPWMSLVNNGKNLTTQPYEIYRLKIF